MSSLSLELANFINPELTWKTGAKGNRNTSRRARKLIGGSLNLGVEFAKKSPERSEDASVTESEKLGVAVLGRRFGDKVEHIPIKKRKLLRSSASPRGGPLSRVSNQLIDKKRSSGQNSVAQSVAKRRAYALKFDNSINDGKMTEVSNEKILHREDFSGIEILAAAACNDSMGDDFGKSDVAPVLDDLSAKEGFGSSASAGTSIGTTHIPQEAPVCEDHLEGSLSDNNSVAVLHSSCSPIKEEGTGNSHESRDGRFLWDLNVVMDAWEQPCDDKTINSHANNLEGISFGDILSGKQEASEGCITQKDYADAKCDVESTVKSAKCSQVIGDADGDIHLVSDSGSLDIGIFKSNEEPRHEAHCSPKCIPSLRKCAPTMQCVLQLSTFDGADANASAQFLSIDGCLNQSMADHATSSLVSDEHISQEPASLIVKHDEDCVTGMRLVEANSKSDQFKESNVARYHTQSAEKTSCKIGDKITDGRGKNSEKTSGLYDDGDSRSSPEEISTGTCQHPDTHPLDNSVRKPHVMGASTLFKDLSVINISVGEGQHLMTLKSRKEEDKTIRDDTVKADISVQSECKELTDKSFGNRNAVSDEKCESTFQESCKSYGAKSASQCGENAFEDPSCHCIHDSDVIQDDQGPMGSTEYGTKFQEDYDSQYEDGELRESDIRCWGENDIEDGEAEVADYEYDDGVRNNIDAAEYCASVSGEGDGGAESEKKQSSRMQLREPATIFLAHSGENAVKNASNEPGKSASSETRYPGLDQLVNGSRKSADISEKANEGKAVAARASRRELVSRTEMPLLSGAIDRKGTVLGQRSRSQNFDDPYQSESAFGLDRSIGRGRFDLHLHDRNQAGDHWVDHPADYWDSKRHNSFNRYGSYDSGYAAPRNVMVNSKGIYRHVIRRSPDERDDTYIMRSTYPRGRSGRYTQGVGRGYRGPKNGYHGSMPDYPTESFRIPQHFSKRDRSFSPLPGRGALHMSHPKRSRSRSRTRSPPMWFSQKEPNMGARDRSRSPDIRTEARIERMRMPFRKSNFVANYERRFTSPPRNRFSPQRNSRWVDKRNCGTDYFGDRRSPVRMFRQNQRFHMVNAPGKLKSDDYFRPMLRHGRLPEVVPSDRTRRYENSDDDRRKYGDRYEIIRPMRRNEKDVFPRHFGHDAEDSLVGRNSLDNDDFVRVTDRRYRDIPRKSREEKSFARYDHEKMIDSGPKSLEMREHEEDASIRPS